MNDVLIFSIVTCVQGIIAAESLQTSKSTNDVRDKIVGIVSLLLFIVLFFVLLFDKTTPHLLSGNQSYFLFFIPVIFVLDYWKSIFPRDLMDNIAPIPAILIGAVSFIVLLLYFNNGRIWQLFM